MPSIGEGRGESPLLVHITTIPMSLTFLRGQVGYMKDRGLRLCAISSPGADLGSFGREERVPVQAVVMHRRVTPFSDVSALARLVRIFREAKPTIVHAHTPKAGLLGMIAASMTRTPVRVYHMRGLPLMGARGWKRRLLWSTEWLACRLAHRVLCVSHSVRAEAIQEGLVEPDKIKVLAGGSGNGVDATHRYNPGCLASDTRESARSALGIPTEATVIGFVGRIVRDKGIIELAEAWQMLRDRHPNAHLLLVGPFEPQDPVPTEVRSQLEQDVRVHLTGMDWNTPPLYAAMDVVVLPTYREGFPNVPLEAAAMKLPVVSTNVPGCVDAVEHGITGTLVPARDSAALALAIAAYLEDPDLRERHGERGRTRALEEFSQPVIWAAIHDEYSGLLRSLHAGAAGSEATGTAEDGRGP